MQQQEEAETALKDEAAASEGAQENKEVEEGASGQLSSMLQKGREVDSKV